MIYIGQLLIFLLEICFWIVILQVVLSWLIVFEVINIRNPKAARFVLMIERITDPVYRPLRKLVPPIAGIDITPIIVILAITVLKMLVASVFFA